MGSKSQTNHTYNSVYGQSIKNPQDFWGEIAESIHWYRKWEKVLDESNPAFHRWFVGGKTNLCYNCVDRHALNNSKEKVAILWESVVLGQSRSITYHELFKEVNRFAGALRANGVRKGDRVVIYLPMVPEAFIAMLACTRIGAIHCVISTGFGVDAIVKRIRYIEPKVLITADGGLRRNKESRLKEIVDKSLEIAPVNTVVVLDRGIVDVTMKKGRDYYWADFVDKRGEEYVDPEQLESSDPSYILYTSSTTTKPYGVVRDTGGYMVALYNSMKQLYDVKDGDVFWATSDIGWIVGHSYTIYAPLLLGITSVMIEGTPDYPDHGIFWRVLEKYGVSLMFSIPTVIRMLRRFGVDHVKKSDTSTLRYLFLAGEKLDAATWHWITDALDNRPVIDHYWTTESGWPMIANMPGIELLPLKPGSPTKPVVGYNLIIVDEQGKQLPPNSQGYLVAVPPLPPGNFLTVWGEEERFEKDYWRQFPGKNLFYTGDYAVADDDGYVAILGRADGLLNVAGHRLGPVEISEKVESHPAVAEACIVGVSDVLRGEIPVCYVVLNNGYESSRQLGVEIKKLIKESIGNIAAPKDIRFVDKLPVCVQDKLSSVPQPISL
jgi:propionyl-CoA synthetase